LGMDKLLSQVEDLKKKLVIEPKWPSTSFKIYQNSLLILNFKN
jgi:hypothetical protein